MNAFSRGDDFFAALLPELLRLIFRSDQLSLRHVSRLAQTCRRGYDEVGTWLWNPTVRAFVERMSAVNSLRDTDRSGQFRMHMVRCLLADWYRAGIFDLHEIPFFLGTYTTRGLGDTILIFSNSNPPYFGADFTLGRFSNVPTSGNEWDSYSFLSVHITITPWPAHHEGGPFQYRMEEGDGFALVRIRPHVRAPAQRYFMYLLRIEEVTVYAGNRPRKTELIALQQTTSIRFLSNYLPMFFSGKRPQRPWLPRASVQDESRSTWDERFEVIKPSAKTPMARPPPLFVDEVERELAFFADPSPAVPPT